MDGSYPGGRFAFANRGSVAQQSEEQSYIQPDINAEDVGQAGEAASQELADVCQISGNNGLTDWVSRNKNTLIVAGIIYAGYRIIRR